MEVATRPEAKKKLEQMFKANAQGVILLGTFAPCSAFVFDFDGVLLHECGIPEAGYAWLARAVREGNWNLHDHDVAESYQTAVHALRPLIKGKPPVEKVEVFCSRFGGGAPLLFSPEQAVEKWFASVQQVIRGRFGHDPNSYLLPGAVDLVKAAREKGQVFGLTANIQRQAEFLMEFVGLTRFFDQIVGYAPDAGTGVDKGTMLADLLSRHGIDPGHTAYIGDGAPDMRAAHHAGALAVGIANDLQGGQRLIDAGCDVIATSPKAGARLVRLLAQGA
jgi:phosphoglycolate phosphatase-like HAD superfamily hydrolase